MTQEVEKTYPKEGRGDVARRLGIALVGYFDALYPGAGFLAQQAAEQILPNPIERRKQAFFDYLVDSLETLQGRLDGVSVETIVKDEQFVTAMLECAPRAIKADRETKRQRFANVALNVAAGRTVHEALRGRFINLVDQFSDEHIHVLRVLANPYGYPELREYAGQLSGPTFQVIQRQLNADGIAADVQFVIYVDLQQERLTPGAGAALGGGSNFSNDNLTDLGKAFLRFIDRPIELYE